MGDEKEIEKEIVFGPGIFGVHFRERWICAVYGYARVECDCDRCADCRR